MSQSLSRIFLHMVFSTKNREKWISPEHEKELFAYIGATINNIGCKTTIIGGHHDHVHCVFIMSRTLTIAKVVEEVKKSSSKWFKTRDKSLSNFCWQSGYGIFSVNYKSVDRIIDYVQNQKTHHSQMDFKDEFIRLLEENGVEYDPKYVWD